MHEYNILKFSRQKNCFPIKLSFNNKMKQIIQAFFYGQLKMSTDQLHTHHSYVCIHRIISSKVSLLKSENKVFGLET